MDKVIFWLLAIAASIVAFFFSLFTFVKIWALIAVPMGAPQINKWQAYGVAILIAHFTAPTVARYVEDKEGETSHRVLKNALVTIVISLASWGIAALLYG